MIRILIVFLFFPIVLASQTGTQMRSYAVFAAMSERTGEITGTIGVRLLVTADSIQEFTFLIPKEMKILSINDMHNEPLDFEPEETNFAKYAVTVQFPEFIPKNDSLVFSFQYAAIYDTSNASLMFVNNEEFLLPFTDSVSWLPNFGALSTVQFSFEMVLPSHFILAADSPFDTTVINTSCQWKRYSQDPSSLHSTFTLCGISNAIIQTSYGSDSLNTVSLISSPFRFNQDYAAAITHQMNEAVKYFSTLTGKPSNRFNRTYVIIGSDQYNTTMINTRNFIAYRNSPAYSVYDTTVLFSSLGNIWLFNIAQYFCPTVNDSTALFNEGFAAYLVNRFLVSKHPQLEKQERFNAIASSLTFFPYGTIAQGRTAKANTPNVFLSKGQYLFFMLDYILGREVFDSIITTMIDRFTDRSITFSEFEQLCEERYGSSLDWFFDQWLYRTTVPDIAMQWENEKTPRGMNIARVSIDQRGDMFSTPLNISFQFGSRFIQKRITLTQQKQEFSFSFPSQPSSVELDPQYNVLRWLLEFRILAHARSAQLFLSINRDIVTAEREALYTIQLDPNNSTGSIPCAYYILGKIAVLQSDLEKAKEYFLKAMPLTGLRETEQYKLWSLIRYANIVEMEGNRNEAVVLLQRAIIEGKKDPVIFEQVIIEAEKYLRETFASNNDLWFGAL